ncbi:MAG: PEP-CTERM system TPR-repeat protein PrsT [Burkholderiaceae bacterium]|nr:PEP-CTERM system TPR-repeat protein PrsT [Rhodoferax sp.]MCP5286440.1 PEP-CTERM system TPR-repeat protein PrsT [Burkholderiaceae bacterium]
MALVTAAAVAGCDGTPPPTVAQPKSVSKEHQPLRARVITLKNQLDADPYSADVRMALGLALLDLADPHSAERELSKALELGLDPNLVLPVLARTWVQLGRPKELIATYGDAQLSHPPAAADLKAALGHAYANSGDPVKAREMAEAALKLDPGSAGARVLQAQIALSDRRVDDAIRIVDETLVAHPDAVDAWELKGDILLLLRNDAGAAKAAYERALDVAPGRLTVRSKLISMALGQGQLQLAEQRYEAMAGLALGSLPQRYFKARLSAAKGDLKAAQADLKVALAEYPKDVRSLLLSAEVDLRLGSLRTATDFLTEANSVAPNVARTRHLLAQVYLRSGTPNKAQAVLEPLVRMGSRDATAMALAAEAALQSGMGFVAARLYERAAAEEPNNPRYRAALAMVRIGKGEVEEGLSDLESAAAADPSTYSDMALLTANLQAGQLAKATVVAERVAAKQPMRPASHWVLGYLNLLSKRPADARRLFERALELDPLFVPAALALANLDLDAGDADRARSRFQSVMALSPNNLDAMLALAEIQFLTGSNVAGVTAALEKAVAVHRGQARPQVALANHLLRTGEYRAALQVAQKANSELPEDVTVLDALGRAQASTGDTVQALATFRRIVTLRPRDHEPLMRMADVLAARKEFPSAIDALKAAAQLRPDLLSAYVKQVELLTTTRNWPEALRVARDLQRRFPNDPRGLHLEGLVFSAQKRWGQAVTAFRDAGKRGESSELTLQLHTALRAHGKADEARKLADQWLTSHPKDGYFLGYLGEVALLAKDFSVAEDHFRAVLRFDPRSVDAMNNLAWLLTAQRKPGAVDIARKALELQPSRMDIADTLSSALAGEGQLQAAIDNQKQALERSGGAPLLRLNLARLAVQAKDFTLARAELDQLSALGKAFPSQGEVWQLRKQLP